MFDDGDQIDRTARSIRRRIAELSCHAKSAHFGSSLSCVEILDAILRVANIHPGNLTAADRDRLVVSKGHAAMGVYAALEVHGLLPRALLADYLGDGSALWGHVTRTAAAPVIDASTGSLGHGLGLALGYAQGYRLTRRDGTVFCVLSDGELDEGSTWEAVLYAGARRFDNLVAVVDDNKIQSLDHVVNVLPLEPLLEKWRAFHWDAVSVDGHDSGALLAALRRPRGGAPRVIIAHTVKGRGVPRIENTVASHYKPALADDADLFS
ncbi:MAG: transketolase [Methylacidiphilales bacterium]|nr:transketolase [Candidatus Methylacidiphilales bacterium]